MSKVKPIGVTADRTERRLKISWNDGHESVYPFAGLRAVCPCAECKGGHANMGGPPDPLVVRDFRNEGINLEQINPVGGYALEFVWNDGHRAGIFTWEYLRQACPCSQCLPKD